ncbi:hypothetical protein BU25DRAFT_453222 [Macroventuria anomochaeta]|uniref:Uncharacterized protein n=1 Tax=Macroventuria anomochaeta TaxID=301207 RepID=A0ACB6SJ24_9PLEO|nr:uncharacterized protein BU25DRAFT_453222 [Macroventuria anomochaeta]KAF2633458.1 hypothetical protein BU25DRAFT_453222 [Macroventuria anomochaeta]
MPSARKAVVMGKTSTSALPAQQITLTDSSGRMARPVLSTTVAGAERVLSTTEEVVAGTGKLSQRSRSHVSFESTDVAELTLSRNRSLSTAAGASSNAASSGVASRESVKPSRVTKGERDLLEEVDVAVYTPWGDVNLPLAERAGAFKAKQDQHVAARREYEALGDARVVCTTCSHLHVAP